MLEESVEGGEELGDEHDGVRRGQVVEQGAGCSWTRAEQLEVDALGGRELLKAAKDAEQKFKALHA